MTHRVVPWPYAILLIIGIPVVLYLLLAGVGVFTAMLLLLAGILVVLIAVLVRLVEKL